MIAYQRPAPEFEQRSQTIQQIAARVLSRGYGLADEIAFRQLYLRVSVIGSCNLACPFCHNEGGPTRGLLDLNYIARCFPMPNLSASVAFSSPVVSLSFART
jgi:hypothetical protein